MSFKRYPIISPISKEKNEDFIVNIFRHIQLGIFNEGTKTFYYAEWLSLGAGKVDTAGS